MPVTTQATEKFPEQGIRGIQIDFSDTDGSAVTPDSIAWTLTDDPAVPGVTPNIINSREAVAVTPDSTIYIILSGDDLALQAGETSQAQAKRILMLSFTFDSAVLGNNVTDYVQYKFTVENIPYLS